MARVVGCGLGFEMSAVMGDGGCGTRFLLVVATGGGEWEVDRSSEQPELVAIEDIGEPTK